MMKEMLMSKFETYLLDEEKVQQITEDTMRDEELGEKEYPPGFFSAL